MEWLTFADVSWLGVLVALVVTFALGALWYSEFAFFPMWARLGGITSEEVGKASMGPTFGQMILGNIVGVVVLAMLMAGLGASGWVEGLALGAIVGFAFRAGGHLVHNGFALRDWRITVIDSAHDTLMLAIAGMTLGFFM